MGEIKRQKALYRLYRSQSFDDVIGQAHITDLLKRAVESTNISHAYLFTGPRGVGKTSVARILAHAINNLPYDGDANHLDIIEIDAASNRGIDEIRELKEKVNLAPTSAKYKVYIIDEVHMLTQQAFNALLKTLEEPPSHVIFILATTESYKIPDTIVSRTQRYAFRPIDTPSVISRLKEIAKKEKIEIDLEALELIAQHGEGSMRDSISLFDQLRAGNEAISVSNVQEMLGLAPQTLINEILLSLDTNDNKLGNLFSDLNTRGFDAGEVAVQLINSLRKSKLTPKKLSLMEDLLTVMPAHNPQLKLEIVLLRHSEFKEDTPSIIKSEKLVTTMASDKDVFQKTTKQVVSSEIDDNSWKAILDIIKTQNNTLYAVLRMANISTEDDNLHLHFTFPFHKRRVDEQKNIQLLSTAITDITNNKFKIKTNLQELKNNSSNDTPPDIQSKDDMRSVIMVMGGGSPVELSDE